MRRVLSVSAVVKELLKTGVSHPLGLYCLTRTAVLRRHSPSVVPPSVAFSRDTSGMRATLMINTTVTAYTKQKQVKARESAYNNRLKEDSKVHSMCSDSNSVLI
jgi:hypothetical protein